MSRRARETVGCPHCACVWDRGTNHCCLCAIEARWRPSKITRKPREGGLCAAAVCPDVGEWRPILVDRVTAFPSLKLEGWLYCTGCRSKIPPAQIMSRPEVVVALVKAADGVLVPRYAADPETYWIRWRRVKVAMRS